MVALPDIFILLKIVPGKQPKLLVTDVLLPENSSVEVSEFITVPELFTQTDPAKIFVAFHKPDPIFKVPLVIEKLFAVMFLLFELNVPDVREKVPVANKSSPIVKV